MEHSPTPWRLGSMEPFAEMPDALVDAQGECIIYCPDGIESGSKLEECLQEMCRCVNAHDTLVGLLRALEWDEDLCCTECRWHKDMGRHEPGCNLGTALAQLE